MAERKVARYVKGYKRIEWVKGKADRNEALDLMVYSLAMAHYLGLHRYGEHDWARMRQALAQGTSLAMMVPILIVGWWRYTRRHPVALGTALPLAVLSRILAVKSDAYLLVKIKVLNCLSRIAQAHLRVGH